MKLWMIKDDHNLVLLEGGAPVIFTKKKQALRWLKDNAMSEYWYPVQVKIDIYEIDNPGHVYHAPEGISRKSV